MIPRLVTKKPSPEKPYALASHVVTHKLTCASNLSKTLNTNQTPMSISESILLGSAQFLDKT